MMKKEYLVTKRAGRWIAGQRVPESGRIELSDFQAAYELALGTIAPLPAEDIPEAVQKKKRRRAKQTREAQAWKETLPSASISTD